MYQTIELMLSLKTEDVIFLFCSSCMRCFIFTFQNSHGQHPIQLKTGQLPKLVA